MDISTVDSEVDDTQDEDLRSGPAPAEEPGEVAPATTPEARADAEEAEDAAPRLGPGEERADDDLRRELFALLFASPEPLSRGRLTELLERPAPARVKALLESLAEELAAGPLPLVLEEVAGTWRLATHPDQGETLQRLQKEPKPERITAAGLETLAIVAYRQPVTKAEVEAIRGVGAGPMLRTLVDRRLIKVTGRADQPGSPLLYGTTREFLERFGLGSLKDLPRDGELAEE